MPRFTKDHVFILPHAEEYRRFFAISVEEVLACLNEPETNEGLPDDRYTAEKAFRKLRVYVYYYVTLPLQGDKEEVYAIVDFIAATDHEGLPKNGHR